MSKPSKAPPPPTVERTAVRLTQPPEPQINPKALYAGLVSQAPIDVENLRFLSDMVLTYAHQQRVVLSYWLTVAKLGNDLNSELNEIEIAGRMRTLLLRTNPENTGEKLDAALMPIAKRINAIRQQMAVKVTEMVECPNENDTIH